MALRLRGVAAGLRTAGEEDQLPAMFLDQRIEPGERTGLDLVKGLPEILTATDRVPNLTPNESSGSSSVFTA